LSKNPGHGPDGRFEVDVKCFLWRLSFQNESRPRASAEKDSGLFSIPNPFHIESMRSPPHDPRVTANLAIASGEKEIPRLQHVNDRPCRTPSRAMDWKGFQDNAPGALSS